MDRSKLKAVLDKVLAFRAKNPTAPLHEIAKGTGLHPDAVRTVAQLMVRAQQRRDPSLVALPPRRPATEIDFAPVPHGGTDSEFYTQFDGLIDNAAAAQVGSDGAPATDLQANAELARLTQSEINAKARPVRITPVSAAALTTVLGAPMVSCTSGGSANSAIYYEGDDEQSQIVTICLANPIIVDAAVTTQSYRPYAKIDWGTRSVRNSVTVDIGYGQQIQVAGSSVYVSVGMDAAPSGATNGTMLLGASLGFFAGAPRGPAVRTGYLDSLTNNVHGTPQTITRPNFATQVIGCDRSDVTAALQLDFLDKAANVVYTRSIAANTYLDAPINLGSNIDAVKVTNLGASTVTAELIFGLSL